MIPQVLKQSTTCDKSCALWIIRLSAWKLNMTVLMYRISVQFFLIKLWIKEAFWRLLTCTYQCNGVKETNSWFWTNQFIFLIIFFTQTSTKKVYLPFVDQVVVLINNAIPPSVHEMNNSTHCIGLSCHTYMSLSKIIWYIELLSMWKSILFYVFLPMVKSTKLSTYCTKCKKYDKG